MQISPVVNHTTPGKSSKYHYLSAVGLAVVQHPSEQIDLGHDSHRLQCTALVLLSDDGSTVPLEEAVQHVERGLHRDLHELATDTSAVGPAQGAGIGDDLWDLGEVEHDLRDGGLAGGAAVSQAAENVTQGDQADETATGWGEDGQLVEALVTHDLNSGFAGEGGGHGGDGLQTESADLGAGKGVGSNGGLSGLSGLGGERSEEVVSGEPVVVGKLDWRVSIDELPRKDNSSSGSYLGEIAADAIREHDNNHVVFGELALLVGMH